MNAERKHRYLRYSLRNLLWLTAIIAVLLSTWNNSEALGFGKTWSKAKSLQLSEQLQGLSGDIDEAIAIRIALDEAWKRGLGSRFLEVSISKGATDYMVTFVPYWRRGERRSGCGIFVDFDGTVVNVMSGR